MGRKNIVLIGMPGAGKSTIGVLLAKALRKPFTDIDLIIQQQENELLQDIIHQRGVKSFLSVEEKAVLGLRVENHVIATGGSIVYSYDAVNHLKENGILIYLQLEFEEIERRITNITSRGIAIHREQKLIDLFKERVPLYEKYNDITVCCSNKHMEDVVAEIIEVLKKENNIFLDV